MKMFHSKQIAYQANKKREGQHTVSNEGELLAIFGHPTRNLEAISGFFVVVYRGS